MNKQIMTRYVLGEHRSINLQHGSIDATDASSESVSIYAGTDAINDAVAAFLPKQLRKVVARTDTRRQTGYTNI